MYKYRPLTKRERHAIEDQAILNGTYMSDREHIKRVTEAQVAYTYERDFTIANLLEVTPDGDINTWTGVAKRNPSDEPNRLMGELLALTRACYSG